jgi:hypothetical protein
MAIIEILFGFILSTKRGYLVNQVRVGDSGSSEFSIC